MEEIFGEINDEHDKIEEDEQQLDEHNYILSARLEIDYLNDKYELNIPEGDYNTLGGYIFAVHENIPTKGEVIDTSLFRITVITVTNNRINEVRLEKK